MKKIAFGLLIMFLNVNIVKGEPSAFFSELEVINGVMNAKYSKYNDMYTVYLDSEEYNLVFNYALEDEDAAVIIENNDYIVDNNEVIVTVVSSDDDEQKQYYFNVYKYDDEEVFLGDNESIPLEIEEKKFYHLESVVAIIAFLLILFVFYKLFLT